MAKHEKSAVNILTATPGFLGKMMEIFSYIRAKFHDFLLGNLSDLIINHCLNSIRLRDSAVFQI